MPTSVQNVAVTADETGMRVDRFLEARFPGLSFSHIQRVIRKGEVRVNGKRTEPKNRLEAGQTMRIPPLRLEQPKPRAPGSEADEKTRAFLQSITLHEDADVLVLNKPMGLAVQGGSGTTRHIDGMLEVLRDAHGQRPRLVHRLDKDTAGCLLVAKTRFAAAALAKTFRSRSARKIYWALVAGVPKVQQGRISTFLAKEEREEESFMRIARHGEKGASHAVTYYAVVETSGPLLAWVSLKPVTGRTHQLRAHMAHIGHPDRRRSEIFFARELGAAGRHAEQAASARPPHRRAASARRRYRRHRAAAAAHAAILESARPRRCALRPDRRGAGGVKGVFIAPNIAVVRPCRIYLRLDTVNQIGCILAVAMMDAVFQGPGRCKSPRVLDRLRADNGQISDEFSRLPFSIMTSARRVSKHPPVDPAEANLVAGPRGGAGRSQHYLNPCRSYRDRASAGSARFERGRVLSR